MAQASRGTPRFFGYGQAWSIAGSASRFAVATASGRVPYFDSASLASQGTIQKLSSELQLSSDGTVLAALGDNLDAPGLDGALNIYSLPSQGLLKSWAYNFTTPYPLDITLSGSGSMLGQVLTAPNGSLTRQVTAATGGSPIWTETFFAGNSLTFLPIRLSPAGSLIAVSDGPAFSPTTGTKMLKNGTLVTAVTGWAVGWLDDNRLLVNTYKVRATPIFDFAGALIFDATGKQIGVSGVPHLDALQPVSTDSIYAPELNLILSVTSGTISWMSLDPVRGVGGVAGAHVVFASGARVLALSH